MRNTPKAKVWQERFHDHIIRNDDEYKRIYDYITDNPNKWENDKYFEKFWTNIFNVMVKKMKGI